MKLRTIAWMTFGLAAFCVCAEDKAVFKDEKEKASYALGLNLADGWKRNDVTDQLDLEAIARGMKDFVGGQQKLTQEEMIATLRGYQQIVNAKREEKRKADAEKNKKDGEAFLAENKTKPGVIALPSGLQYQVITEGTGEMPKPTDTIEAHYRGTLIDGTEFDSSYSRNQPLVKPVGGLIDGWKEALAMMKTGSKWKLFVPSELGYKEHGSGKIGPNAALIFEMELLSIKPPPPPPPPTPAPAPGPITSDIIKVPSAEEMKKGAKIETIKPEDIQKEIEKEKARQAQTNQPPKN